MGTGHEHVSVSVFSWLTANLAPMSVFAILGSSLEYGRADERGIVEEP